jgi:RNA polymerase primary sigma factor
MNKYTNFFPFRKRQKHCACKSLYNKELRFYFKNGQSWHGICLYLIYGNVLEVNVEKGKKPITDESLLSYIDQVRKLSLLTFEEEQELSKRIQDGDETARHRLIEGNLRLVIKIAKAYVTPDAHLADLIQEGNMGLMHAAEKYDHSKQVRFSTYACWWIRQAISRFLCNKRRVIRLPQKKEEILRKIHHVFHSLTQFHARKPTFDEIATEVGVSREDVESLLNMSLDIIPLDTGVECEEFSAVIDSYEDRTYCPEKVLMKKSSRETTLRVLNNLKEREKNVLIKRYDFNGKKRSTLKHISNEMGIAPETVRQIELKALLKLHCHHAEELRVHFEAR